MFEIEGKPDSVSDRICALGLKENSRFADIRVMPEPFFNCTGRLSHTFSLPSLLETASPSDIAAQDASDPR